MKSRMIFFLSLLLMFAITSVDARSSSHSSSSRSSSHSSPSKSSSYKSSPSYSSASKSQIKYSKSTVSKLPSNYRTVKHKGVSYYAHGGKYYKRSGSRYVLTYPPFGLRVSVLPPSYYSFMYMNRPYYCYDGIIYQSVDSDEYEIVAPEVGMVVPELPEVNVSEVTINDKIYFEFDNVLYKQIPTQQGLMYEVVGSLDI